MSLTRRCRQLLVFPLVAVLLMSGCSGETTQEKAQAMGRYVEEVVALPEELYWVLSLTAQDTGEVRLIGETEEGLRLWNYRDGGWVPQEAPWCEALQEMDILWLSAVTLDSKGTPYCVYYPLEEGMNPEDYQGFRDDLKIPAPVLAYYRDGRWQDSGIPADHYNNSPNGMVVLEDGGVALGYDRGLTVFRADGAVAAEYTSGDWMREGSFGEINGQIAYTDRNQLFMYDPASGQMAAEISLQRNDAELYVEYTIGRPPQTAFCWDSGRNAICYANKSGIYQVTADGQLTEKLVDGALTSLVMPSVEVLELVACADGSFLLHGDDSEGEPLLFRYRYDADVPTTPTTELRIYSLADVPTVRQAMGSFQRENPDVTIRYDIGWSAEDGITQEDALKAISAQILAGDGPDLLVLDGLPVESYIEKGVLADLGELPEDLFPNIARAFHRDGVLYALPASFLLPLLLSEEEAVDQVQTPADLALYLQGQQNPRIGFEPQSLFMEMSWYFFERWLPQGEKLDAQTLAQDLKAFAQMQEQLSGIPNPRGGAEGGDYITSGLVYKENSINLTVRSLFALNNLQGVYTGIAERGGVLTHYPLERRYFRPTTVLGVNAGGKQQQLAQDYIAHILSLELQSYELGDGLPVNREAYRTILQSREEREIFGAWGLHKVHPVTGEEEFFVGEAMWPDRDFQQLALDLAETATTPLWVDRDILQIVWQETNRYFSGESTLEQAVQAAENKVNVRLAE